MVYSEKNIIQITHTLGHVECPACARAQQLLYQNLSGDLLFPAAFDIWISHRAIEADGVRTNVRFITRKTERDYRVCAKALGRFFGRLRLEEIDEGHLAGYQRLRASNPIDTVNGTWHAKRGKVVHGDFAALEDAEQWAAAHGGGCEFVQTAWSYQASANCIRKEIALLERILRDALLWSEERTNKFLKVQAVEPDVERAMSREEQHRLLHVAAGPAKHRFMYCYVLLALQTMAGPNELRHLRLGDVFLDPAGAFIQIPAAGAKNKYRKRTIPLVTEDAVWAMEGLIGFAKEKGAWSPAHYLFPIHKARTQYDPNRPMSESGLKKPWEALRREAQMPALRIYDLRHSGITRMAEAGVPLPVTMSFAGHMTLESQQRYTAICMSAQRQWGMAVWGASANVPTRAETAQVRAAFDGARKPVASVRPGDRALARGVKVGNY